MIRQLRDRVSASTVEQVALMMFDADEEILEQIENERQLFVFQCQVDRALREISRGSVAL